MAEGLSATEIGKEIGEHAKHAGEHAPGLRHDRLISIAEAVLLSIVTITAAWSGFSAAKWSTESSLELAKASTTRAKANRAFQESLTLRSSDGTTFNAWFSAYIAGKRNDARVAEKRFRPQYKVAFDAWMATHPFTHPNAAKGPQFMPQYKPTGLAQSKVLDASADAHYLGAEGGGDATNTCGRPSSSRASSSSSGSAATSRPAACASA